MKHRSLAVRIESPMKALEHGLDGRPALIKIRDEDGRSDMIRSMGKFGRYRVAGDGRVVRDPDGAGPGSAEPVETGQLHSQLELPQHVVGPTRLGEWLMVDVRVAKAVPRGSRLYAVCQALGERRACGVVEHTLIIDLLEASAEDRAFLLRGTSWPPIA
jgi:hypothetical protein